MPRRFNPTMASVERAGRKRRRPQHGVEEDGTTRRQGAATPRAQPQPAAPAEAKECKHAWDSAGVPPPCGCPLFHERGNRGARDGHCFMYAANAALQRTTLTQPLLASVIDELEATAAAPEDADPHHWGHREHGHYHVETVRRALHRSGVYVVNLFKRPHKRRRTSNERSKRQPLYRAPMWFLRHLSPRSPARILLLGTSPQSPGTDHAIAIHRGHLLDCEHDGPVPLTRAALQASVDDIGLAWGLVDSSQGDRLATYRRRLRGRKAVATVVAVQEAPPHAS